MMFRLALTLFCFAVPFLKAEQKCELGGHDHGVRHFDGKPCASTSLYNDNSRGSCGCGPAGTNTPFDWNQEALVASASQNYFDNGRTDEWCGDNCGRCVKLTPTGGFMPGKGRAPPNNHAHVFLVTDDCQSQFNAEWCDISGRPGTGRNNSHGYEVHFELQNHIGQVQHLGWSNIEVVWEEVNCPSDFHRHWSQCECFGRSSGK